jgi:hypothetical protein
VKILFVARHAPQDNCDENALTYALEQLGHTVHCVEERSALDWLRSHSGSMPADLILFLKWAGAPLVRTLPGPYRDLPLVGWFFDLVRSTEGDPTLAARDAHRVAWLRATLPHCLLMALTDGDEVARDRTGKLLHMMQGADERVIGPGVAPVPDTRPPLLFAGMVNHGQRRASHIALLKARYGEKLEILGDGGPARRKHGRELADTMAGRIVLAPDGPQTDAYCSNRLVQACGFGAFVVHPYCAVAAAMYGHGEGVVYYGDRAECNTLIDQYLGPLADRREAIARAGYKRTLWDGLYRHRVAELMAEVERRLSCRT